MKTILIVEDEPDISLALEIVFQMEGYEVIRAANGREALERIEEKRPDLILTDIMMPELTGLEMLDEIQKTPYRSVPVILMSAAQMQSELQKKGRRSWVGFVKKPIDIDHLVNLVSRTLEDQAKVG